MRLDNYHRVNFIDNNDSPRNKILIGQVHGHPTSTEPGKVTQSAMSSADTNTASGLQIAIYGCMLCLEVGGKEGLQISTEPIRKVPQLIMLEITFNQMLIGILIQLYHMVHRIGGNQDK